MFSKVIIKKMMVGSLLFLLQNGQSCPIPHKNTTEFFAPSKEPAPEENRAVLIQEDNDSLPNNFFMLLLPGLLEAFYSRQEARQEHNEGGRIVSLIRIVTQEDQNTQIVIFHPIWEHPFWE